MTKTIYMDNAATTLIKPRGVRKNMNYALERLGSPGRGGALLNLDLTDIAPLHIMPIKPYSFVNTFIILEVSP